MSGFSTRQVAEAADTLAEAGISAADIGGGALRATLELASAGRFTLPASGITVAEALERFRLTGRADA